MCLLTIVVYSYRVYVRIFTTYHKLIMSNISDTLYYIAAGLAYISFSHSIKYTLIACFG